MGWLRKVFDAVSKEEMQGLRLSGPSWVISGDFTDPSSFFRALAKLVPDDAILFLEGGEHPPQLRALLDEHKLFPSLRPALGTIWPRLATFALPSTPVFLDSLAESAESCAAPEVCAHLHVYRGEQVLLEGYDAFRHPVFHVSQAIPQERVCEFCADLGASWSPDTRFA